MFRKFSSCGAHRANHTRRPDNRHLPALRRCHGLLVGFDRAGSACRSARHLDRIDHIGAGGGIHRTAAPFHAAHGGGPGRSSRAATVACNGPRRGCAPSSGCIDRSWPDRPAPKCRRHVSATVRFRHRHEGLGRRRLLTRHIGGRHRLSRRWDRPARRSGGSARYSKPCLVGCTRAGMVWPSFWISTSVGAELVSISQMS